MEQIIKKIIISNLEKDIAEWEKENKNGDILDTTKLFLGYVAYPDASSLGSFRVLIPSSVSTPYNSFFIDIMNKDFFGIINGFTASFMTRNTGKCVYSFESLSNKLGKNQASLEEIKEFISETNRDIINDRNYQK